MSTREKILQVSLALFNAEGFDAVSLKTIAKEMNISDGNLRYYFRTKEDLVLAHFTAMDTAIESTGQGTTPENFNLQRLFDGLREAFAVQENYRYILIDLVSLYRSSALFRAAFDNLYRKRRQLFMQMFSFLQYIGLLRQENIQGQYESLFRQFFLLSNFWLSEAEIGLTLNQEEKITNFSKLAFDLLLPMFTEMGLAQYGALKFY